MEVHQSLMHGPLDFLLPSPLSQQIISVKSNVDRVTLSTVRLRRSVSSKASKSRRSSASVTHKRKEASPRSCLREKPQPQIRKFNSINGFLDKIRDIFKTDELTREISLIALPAIISLATEPTASLVDTAFIGQIGPIELAGVGVSISIFNIVSKLFNIPLLNVTTSFVAEDEALVSRQNKADKSSNESTEEDAAYSSPSNSNQKLRLPAVSTALILAVSLGIAETIVLILGAGYFINTMGIPPGSMMHNPAEEYLSIRALGAPGAVVSLVLQGVFRGLKDTKTPLYATGIGNLINVALDPIFMFAFGFGVGGAAIATVVSEYFIAIMLLWNLNKKISFVTLKMEKLRFGRYIKSGALLFGRTMAVLLTFTLGTSAAAHQGAINMATHQICLQVWLSVSLLTDSLALAGQALLANSVSKKEYLKAKQVVLRVLQIGLGSGFASAMILFIGFVPLSKLFTNDTAVLELASTGVLFVAGTQPINALAFIFDGLLYGVSDFTYAASSMILIGAVSSIWLGIVPSSLGLNGVWAGLTIFMILRMAAGFLRLYSMEGPWWFMEQIGSKKESENE
eukprot:TRINITY_DN1417_c0_g1_i2.p1 TRINITY_DN1417_c0_g1~~TRINITY_DN1417_c0_g1_i2.p1  ORF type:complete len:569 (+),score=111.18 TRINITY_DN1417_c0_g1_i2:348-2054(+)